MQRVPPLVVGDAVALARALELDVEHGDADVVRRRILKPVALE